MAKTKAIKEGFENLVDLGSSVFKKKSTRNVVAQAVPEVTDVAKVGKKTFSLGNIVPKKAVKYGAGAGILGGGVYLAGKGIGGAVEQIFIDPKSREEENTLDNKTRELEIIKQYNDLAGSNAGDGLPSYSELGTGETTDEGSNKTLWIIGSIVALAGGVYYLTKKKKR